ncbi:hypothetical protein BS50DRAFT_569686, partial [Corynespora cassiicola Philippines]
MLPPFVRRRSSDLPAQKDLQAQVAELQLQLALKTAEAEAASARAARAEQKEARIKELARKFWRDEFSGMKEYMSLMGDEKQVREIEKRMLVEYDELFS